MQKQCQTFKTLETSKIAHSRCLVNVSKERIVEGKKRSVRSLVGGDIDSGIYYLGQIITSFHFSEGESDIYLTDLRVKTKGKRKHWKRPDLLFHYIKFYLTSIYYSICMQKIECSVMRPVNVMDLN